MTPEKIAAALTEAQKYLITKGNKDSKWGKLDYEMMYALQKLGLLQQYSNACRGNHWDHVELTPLGLEVKAVLEKEEDDAAI